MPKTSDKRAYLFHWCWLIGLGKKKPSDAPVKAGVDIEWDHGSDAKSTAGANEMITGFGLAVPPNSNVAPSVTSNHIAGKAVDMKITLWAALASSAGCALATGAPALTVPDGDGAEPEYGWVVGPSLASKSPHLPNGLPVSVVVTSDPQSVARVHVGGLTQSAESCPALAQGRASMNESPDVFFYALPDATLKTTDIGVAVLGSRVPPVVTGGIARMETLRGGRTSVFTACATSEGVNLAVWSDHAYRGEPRWSADYYLGIDMEPTCPR